MIIHNHNFYTIVDLLSDFGGLFEPFVLPLFFFLGKIINDHYIMGKLIRSLYYTSSNDSNFNRQESFKSQNLNHVKHVKQLREK